MSIVGLPGASEPSFMTRDRALVSFDTLISNTVAELAEAGVDISNEVAKATVQCARQLVCSMKNLDKSSLSEIVMRELRRFRIILVRPLVEAVLQAYAGVVSRMDIEVVY